MKPIASTNRRRPAWLMLLAAGVTLVPALLLSGIAAAHLRSVAGAVAARERDSRQQFARVAARELARHLAQAEEDVLQFLDPATEESLVTSLHLAETAFPGIHSFAVMTDGRLLYPVDPATNALTRLVIAQREALMLRLGTSGLGHAVLTATPSPLLASLHELRSDRARGLIGVAWGPTQVDAWCDRAAQDVLDGHGTIAVLGGKGQRLGSGGSSPAAPRERFAAADTLAPWESLRLPLRIGVEPDAPLAVDRLLHRQVMLQSAGLASLCLLMVAGVLLLLWVAWRQLELGRMKTDFAANVSHELRTPLTLIRAAADSLLTREALDPVRQSRYLRIIQSESARLSDLVDTVLRFSRLQRRAQRWAFAPTDVNRMVHDVLDRYGAYLQEQGFTLCASFSAEPMVVAMDREGLQLVLANLLDNAVKFSPTCKAITVTVTRRDRHAVISITDAGIGIAAEEHSRLFDSFYRVEPHRGKATRGTGIGLSLAREIVLAHHGRITVDSRPGEGATFTVLIPLPGGEA